MVESLRVIKRVISGNRATMEEILRSKGLNRATMVEIFLRHSGPILSGSPCLISAGSVTKATFFVRKI